MGFRRGRTDVALRPRLQPRHAGSTPCHCEEARSADEAIPPVYIGAPLNSGIQSQSGGSPVGTG